MTKTKKINFIDYIFQPLKVSNDGDKALVKYQLDIYK